MKNIQKFLRSDIGHKILAPLLNPYEPIYFLVYLITYKVLAPFNFGGWPWYFWAIKSPEAWSAASGHKVQELMASWTEQMGYLGRFCSFFGEFGEFEGWVWLGWVGFWLGWLGFVGFGWFWFYL